MKHENELWPQDDALIKKLNGHFHSCAEQQFFEKLQQKMFDENAPWPETLIWEHENPDQIYLLRQGYDEFMVGHGTSLEEWSKNEIHTMCLSDALSVNLKDIGVANKNQTLFDWLRENDYKYVRYDHSNDGNQF